MQAVPSMLVMTTSCLPSPLKSIASASMQYGLAGSGISVYEPSNGDVVDPLFQ